MSSSRCCAREGKIVSFVSKGCTVETTEHGEHVLGLFNCIPDLEGVVVVRDGIPMGLIMRTYFFQKLGTPYGLSFYAKRPVSILMETAITCVDYNDSIDEVSKLVTLRDHNNLYDYIIVTQDNKYLGVISIRQFLIELSERNKRQLTALQIQNEKELKLRTSLEKKTQSIANLLNNAGQGFLSFGEDLMIKGEYSSECKKIFNEEIGYRNYLDVISQYYPDEKRTIFESILEHYFVNTDIHTDSVYLSLFPTETLIDEKNILFDYKNIYDSKEKKVMVILTDISEKKKMEQELEQDRENHRLIIKCIICKSDISQMICEFKEATANSFAFYDRHGTLKEYLIDFFRLIHTFKGDFAQCSFNNTMRALHSVENQIDELLKSPSIEESEVESLLNHIKSTDYFSKDLDTVESALGTGFFDESNQITITEDRLYDVLHELCNSVPENLRENVIELYKKLTNKSLAALLLEYKDYVSYLSGRLEKNQPEFTISGDTIFIDEKKYSAVLKNLIHIFKNSVDHGLETEEERIALDKNPSGMISCYIRDHGSSFTIEISDDGRGIDFDKLKAKAVEKGIFSCSEIATMNEIEQHSLIFMDHLSTKDGVSQISGRGIGMSSLQNECSHLGGNIVVTSEKFVGTKFAITLPNRSSNGGNE